MISWILLRDLYMFFCNETHKNIIIEVHFFKSCFIGLFEYVALKQALYSDVFVGSKLSRF